MAFSAHYISDVVPLLDDCIDALQKTIDQDLRGSHDALYEMKDVLMASERTLHSYLNWVLETEKKSHPSETSPSLPVGEVNSIMNQNDRGAIATPSGFCNATITETLSELKRILELKQGETIESRRQKYLNPQDPIPSNKGNSDIGINNNGRQRQTYTARSATDSLLFRLIVALQLCLVRIDDAHFVLTGRRIGAHPGTNAHDRVLDKRLFLLTGCCCVLGAGYAIGSFASKGQGGLQRRMTLAVTSRDSGVGVDTLALMKLVAEGGIALSVGKWLHSTWKTLWMTDKIVRSTNEIEDWLTQWQMVQEHSSRGFPLYDDGHRHKRQQKEGKATTQQQQKEDILDETSSRLIEYSMKSGPRSYFWQTQGEIRFLMLKRFMDVYYASVGTAIDATGANTQQTSSWQIPLVTGAAASFYSLTGASEKASQAVNTSSKDLIQNAWGMVSLPAIKTLMLQASRLLKGASVADRVEICGVSCFILSRDPAPELAAAIKRQDNNGKYQQHTKAVISTMSTIGELEDHSPVQPKVQGKRFAGLSGRYRQRDVIFHLTGGGFFAHTIASDLPYLLDWSASTGAVIICPEYPLLPEHTWPVALEQIAEVYSALIDGDAVIDLGFEVNRLVVTGESAGGNLAAALCVKLGMQKIDQDSLDVNGSSGGDGSFDCMSIDTLYDKPTRLPDAIMLSCPALNLSLEITQSRVLGMKDPVLPSGLISAISDAYLPQGMNKMDPLASPFFAVDQVLKLFPPVLMFAGSNDPLLDDSVTYNERLRCLGVDSELRVAHNMPHAYWGLGTAGFPEAQQVQQECQEWLNRQLDSGR